MSSYRYAGPTDGEHILDADPLTVATMKTGAARRASSGGHLLPARGRRPRRRLPVRDRGVRPAFCQRVPLGAVPGPRAARPGVAGPPDPGPNLLFLDRVGRQDYLGMASYHWGWGALLTARDTELFPTCEPGGLDVSTLRPSPNNTCSRFRPGGHHSDQVGPRRHRRVVPTRLPRRPRGRHRSHGLRGRVRGHLRALLPSVPPASVQSPSSPAPPAPQHRHPPCRALRPPAPVVVVPLGSGRGPRRLRLRDRVDECPSSIEGPGR